MKLKVFLHYLTVFSLSALAGSLYFAKDVSLSKEETHQIKVPNFVQVNINQNEFITQLAEDPTLLDTVTDILHANQQQFLKIASPIYRSTHSSYIFCIYERLDKDLHFALLKKSDTNAQINLVSTFKVKYINHNSLELSYGHVKYLSQDEFNEKALKLAQSFQLEDSF
ncbi:MAG: hypothetical protein ACK41T_05595 [Pseudobdellovibrio sp.]